MDNIELKERLGELRKNLKLFDSIVDTTIAKIKGKDTVEINLRQAKLVKDLIDLFDELNWQLALNNHKKIEYTETEVIRNKTLEGTKTGDPVKVRPVGEKYKGKTYFGILIGDVATTIQHSISGETMTAKFSHYNPAILIPELNEIVYGYESWWGEIDETQIDDVITDETIENVWYVKALKNLTRDSE